jgi:hypothetical protein
LPNNLDFNAWNFVYTLLQQEIALGELLSPAENKT